MSQLTADCLHEIFEHLKDMDIRSCLLVNSRWCEVSVRFIWKHIQNYHTLIACLSNESKEIFSKENIILSSQNPNPPLFNYGMFIQNIEFNDFAKRIKYHILEVNDHKIVIVMEEIVKMLMNQISLKTLVFNQCSYSLGGHYFSYLPLERYPRAMDFFKNLSELDCCTNIHSGLFLKLSKWCHDIQTLKISFTTNNLSKEFSDLISIQQNLKCLKIKCCGKMDTSSITQHFNKFHNTLIKLDLNVGRNQLPISFVAKFTNLQELILSCDNMMRFHNLDDIVFPTLRTLKFTDKCPRDGHLCKFIENNGKNLKELHLNDNNNLANFTIAGSCPKLKSLRTDIWGKEIENLSVIKAILHSCQQLERLEVKCSRREDHVDEEILLEYVVDNSPGNFHKLIIRFENQSKIFSGSPENLDSIFTKWENRIRRIPLSLILHGSHLKIKEDNMKVLEKFKKLNVIKTFKIDN